MESVEGCDVLMKVWFRHAGNADAIINVSPEELGLWSGVLGGELVFEVAHEQIGKRRAHFSAHGYTRNLMEIFAIKFKRVKGQD